MLVHTVKLIYMLQTCSPCAFITVTPYTLTCIPPLERFHTHGLCRLRNRMQCYQMESFTRSPDRQKCRRRLRHSEMQPEMISTRRRSGRPPDCRLQYFLMSPFTRKWRVAGDGHLFVILTVPAWFESVSLVSQSSEYLFSLGYFLLWECAHYLSTTSSL